MVRRRQTTRPSIEGLVVCRGFVPALHGRCTAMSPCGGAPAAAPISPRCSSGRWGKWKLRGAIRLLASAFDRKNENVPVTHSVEHADVSLSDAENVIPSLELLNVQSRVGARLEPNQNILHPRSFLLAQSPQRLLYLVHTASETGKQIGDRGAPALDLRKINDPLPKFFALGRGNFEDRR